MAVPEEAPPGYGSDDAAIKAAELCGPGSGSGSGGEGCPLQDGYGAVTAGVFLASVSVGANLLNVPHGMAHLGWLALPMIAVLGIQSLFCSHLLASSWVILQELEPSLRGPVHKPYPLIADRAFGLWARHTTSLVVLLVDTITAVMLLVLASDLVASIVIYAFPRAQPTICLMIILLATFLCPFTWFQSPKNFWMVGVVGLTTSGSAWLLMLMKMCADYCKRATPPARPQPPPLHMMVGMSSICNCFTSGSVQPTIQADMRDRSAFSSAITGVWIVLGVVVISFASTSYVLIGNEAKSSVVHNLEPGRMSLVIQAIMLLHVLTSFVIYINPLYQELEENLSIYDGSWRQITFRTLCMGLLVLMSEAMPDFGNVLDIMSVLAIINTLVLPPILYLRLTTRTDVELTLNTIEKAFLVCLSATGLIYTLVAGYGTSAFVFAEQQQGTCFNPRHLSSLNTTSTTTPASRDLLIRAKLLEAPET